MAISIDPVQFEKRKKEHISLALKSAHQAIGLDGLEKIHLIHEALPEIDLNDVSLEIYSLKKNRTTPFVVSAMTAGHGGALQLNALFAKACSLRGWAFAVGSQRRQIGSSEVASEWRELRERHPNLEIFANLGLSQLMELSSKQVEELVVSVKARAIFIHLNSLQEALQMEGTPQFRGGLHAIYKLCRELSVPVLVKETGCGFSANTLFRLKDSGVAAVDVSGLGGTHWGRIEGERAATSSSEKSKLIETASQTFANWGESLVDSMLSVQKVRPDYEVWASGGVRSGLQAAKLLAMGAKRVGLAQPLLQAALISEKELLSCMERLEFELKIALFCTGSNSIEQLQEKRPWRTE